MRNSWLGAWATALTMLLVICVFSIDVSAQSGRRLPKDRPATVAQEIPDPPPQPKPPPKPDFSVKVYSDIDFGSQFGFPRPERMHTWSVERLEKSSLLDVRDGGSANRRDAIKQAKVETEAYVVLLELKADPFSPYGQSNARAMSIYLTVYHPVSAKVKFSRTLALGQNSTRLPGSSRVLQACNPTVYGNDLLLLEASIEAADSVLSSFNIPRPPLCSNAGRI